MFRDQAEVSAFVSAIADPMIKHVETKYGIKDFKVKIRCDFSKRRRTSLGGVNKSGPYVSLALRHLNQPGDKINLTEYAHIASDPEIGSMRGDWKDVVASVFAHELAHAVQHFRFNKAMMLGEAFSGGLATWPSTDIACHGELWQSIYRDLRTNFVNSGWHKNVKYSFTKTVASVKTIKRVINKPFFTREVNKDGGRHALYYRSSDNSLIGKLFKRETGKVQFAPAGVNKYVWTQFMSTVEARKALIEPLV